jgi:group I intron endonuclease
MNTGRVYKIYNTADMNKIYVGSSKQTLTKRLAEHKSCAKLGRTSKIYNYIREKNYENFRIVLLEEMKYNDKSQLREREDFYINQLKPELNTNNAVLNLEKAKQAHKIAIGNYQKTEKGKKVNIEKRVRHQQKKKQLATLEKQGEEVQQVEQKTQ